MWKSGQITQLALNEQMVPGISIMALFGQRPKELMSCRTRGISVLPSFPPLGHWGLKSAVSGLMLAL